jgi:hypothetical protein
VAQIPDKQPAIFSAFRALIGLYHDEIIKAKIEQDCRAKVRAENAMAAE